MKIGDRVSGEEMLIWAVEAGEAGDCLAAAIYYIAAGRKDLALRCDLSERDKRRISRNGLRWARAMAARMILEAVGEEEAPHRVS